MLRQYFTNIRLFLGLFQDIPPVPAKVLWPGLVGLVSYFVLSIALGPADQPAAFVTAFVLAVVCRVAARLDRVLRKLRQNVSPSDMYLLVMAVGLGPLALLIWSDDPLWCQRMQSLYYIVLGSMFLSDVLGEREDMAALFWPWEEMKPHLHTLTRMMVLFHMSFLLLNETMIRVLVPSGWLVFWAVLPVISHLILSALILTVVTDRRGGPV